MEDHHIENAIQALSEIEYSHGGIVEIDTDHKPSLGIEGNKYGLAKFALALLLSAYKQEGKRLEYDYEVLIDNKEFNEIEIGLKGYLPPPIAVLPVWKSTLIKWGLIFLLLFIVSVFLLGLITLPGKLYHIIFY